jgi:hypothetical protein
MTRTALILPVAVVATWCLFGPERQAEARDTSDSRPVASRTVSCDEVIDRVRTGRGGSGGGRRVILGVVSVAQAYRPQVVPTGRRPWSHVSKAGLAVLGGSPAVVVSVPRRWRNRAAISWGNLPGIYTTLRIARCPASTPTPWNVYAGGFFLRSPSGCVPLTLRVGSRSASVRFGLAQTCRAR